MTLLDFYRLIIREAVWDNMKCTAPDTGKYIFLYDNLEDVDLKKTVDDHLQECVQCMEELRRFRKIAGPSRSPFENHPTRDDLFEYGSQNSSEILSEEQVQRIEAHLLICEPCSTYVRDCELMDGLTDDFENGKEIPEYPEWTQEREAAFIEQLRQAFVKDVFERATGGIIYEDNRSPKKEETEDEKEWDAIDQPIDEEFLRTGIPPKISPTVAYFDNKPPESIWPFIISHKLGDGTKLDFEIALEMGAIVLTLMTSIPQERRLFLVVAGKRKQIEPNKSMFVCDEQKIRTAGNSMDETRQALLSLINIEEE